MHGNISMKNTYTIYKYVNDKKVILAHFHNLITNKLKQNLTSNLGVKIDSVWFGDGNKEPSATDTQLGHAKWSFYDSNISSLKEPTLTEDGTWNIECTAKIDATTTYTGTVSELGIYCTYGNARFLATHALIKDAEGNPMTITKTDAEVLYVDIHIQYRLGENGGFKWTPWYYYLLVNGFNSPYNRTLPAFNALHVAMLRAYPDMMSNGNRAGNEVRLTESFSTSTGILTCSGGRFGTENVTTQEYINAIGIIPSFWDEPTYDYNRPNLQIGYWTFPNQDIFPNQTLKNIRVGTGDGTTKDFDPPLYLWVKDSEKIYIDGVLKVRDVDYTCDNNNNRGNLSALHPSNFSILKTEMVRQPNLEEQGMGFHPLKGGYNKIDEAHSGPTRRVYLKWDKDHPLEWEINEDPQIGLAADYFQMNSIHNTAGYHIYWKNAVFILSYSADGKTWEEAGRWTCTEDTLDATHKFEFSETISAKHWKLETDLTGCSDDLKNGRFYTEEISYLQKNWKPISFKTAPAAGAIITMEADIDRPMKNSNFLLDVNPTFQL